MRKESCCKSRSCLACRPTKSGTSTEDEWPIKSPMSSREHVVPFSCCFLTGWLACLFTLPKPHILKNPTKIQSFQSFQKLISLLKGRKFQYNRVSHLRVWRAKLTAVGTSQDLWTYYVVFFLPCLAPHLFYSPYSSTKKPDRHWNVREVSSLEGFM